MKTDTEIKEWIDSKEVFTLTELSKFIFGSSQPLITKREESEEGIWVNKPLYKWWGYSLKNKNLAKMKSYKKYKMRPKDSLWHKNKSTIEGVIRENKELSGREIKTLLEGKYNIKIELQAILFYKKRLGIEGKIQANHRKVLIAEADPELKKLSTPKACKAFRDKYSEDLSHYVLQHFRNGSTKYRGHSKYMGERYVSQRAKKQKIMGILAEDKRFFECGGDKGSKFLLGMYGIKVHQDTLYNYKKEFINNRSQNV